MVQDNPGTFHSAVFDAIPSPVFVVEEDVRIVAFNQAATPLLAAPADIAMRWRCGDAFRCINSFESHEGCGRGYHCKDCAIRQSVTASLQGQKVMRRATKMEFSSDSGVKEIYLLVTTSPMEFESQRYVLLVLEDVNELMELRRVLPICSSCKKIRDDASYWASVEEYFAKHWDVDFTHSVCPDCMKKLYPEYYDSRLKDQDERKGAG
jgi:hypothetical protein